MVSSEATLASGYIWFCTLVPTITRKLWRWKLPFFVDSSSCRCWLSPPSKCCFTWAHDMVVVWDLPQMWTVFQYLRYFGSAPYWTARDEWCNRLSLPSHNFGYSIQHDLETIRSNPQQLKTANANSRISWVDPDTKRLELGSSYQKNMEQLPKTRYY